MANGYQGLSNAAFLGLTVSFSEQITATPTEFGLVAGEASAFAVVQTAFAESYQTALSAPTRTKVTIEQRNAAREACETSLRFLVDRINGTPSVTDAQKISLGINVRKQPSPIGIPTAIPTIVVKGVRGRSIDILLTQGEGEGRRKPSGVHSAVVYTYTGAEPVPDDITKWANQGSCTRTDFTIDLPLSVPAFSKVYLTAAWRNPREQAGPLADPIYLFLGGGVASGAA